MSNLFGANLMRAVEPFSQPEIQTQTEHRFNVGYRADSAYFEMFPKRRHAVRLALTEFDVLALFGDVPPPKLYVFVTRLSPTVRIIEPMYRGQPFWVQRYCGNFEYADRTSNRLLFALRLCCQEFGGMLTDARTQCETHRKFIAANRCVLGLERVDAGKAI